jgi:hypothetical protein
MCETVKTASGATVVQIVHSSHRGSREEAGHSLPLCLIAASKPYGT